MKLSRGGVFQSDLDEILEGVGDSWNQFRNSDFLILGGTGFIGTWLVSALLNANQALTLNLNLNIITRNPQDAATRLKFGSSDPISLLKFDLRNAQTFDLPPKNFYMHAATPSVTATGSSDESSVQEATIGGMQMILDLIGKNPKESSFLHTSSGAVYGPQPLDLERRLEGNAVNKDDLISVYAKSKVAAEELLNSAIANGITKGSNPRLFAFEGPHISTVEHFAIGNFLHDGLKGRQIQVKGNGNTVRSYLYPTDLTVWLLKLLANPCDNPINIGSDIPVTMLELANIVSELTSKKGVDFLNPSTPASRYVPSIENAKRILQVKPKVSLVEGLERWIKWLEATKK